MRLTDLARPERCRQLSRRVGNALALSGTDTAIALWCDCDLSVGHFHSPFIPTQLAPESDANSPTLPRFRLCRHTFERPALWTRHRKNVLNRSHIYGNLRCKMRAARGSSMKFSVGIVLAPPTDDDKRRGRRPSDQECCRGLAA